MFGGVIKFCQVILMAQENIHQLLHRSEVPVLLHIFGWGNGLTMTMTIKKNCICQATLISHVQTHMKIQVQGITSHMKEMVTCQRGLEAKAYVPQYLLHRSIILTGCRTSSAMWRHPIQFWCITRFRIISQRKFIDNGGKLECQFF